MSSWGKLTKDQNILQIVKGYRIPFLCRLKQKREQKGNKLFNAREGNNLIRSGKSLEEGCCGTSLSTKTPISEQYIFSEKEGWRQKTCDQFEGVKPMHSLQTFQNGELTVAEDSLAKKTSTCAN